MDSLHSPPTSPSPETPQFDKLSLDTDMSLSPLGEPATMVKEEGEPKGRASRRTITSNACTACRKRRKKVSSSAHSSQLHHSPNPLTEQSHSLMRWPIPLRILLSLRRTPFQDHVHIRDQCANDKE